MFVEAQRLFAEARPRRARRASPRTLHAVAEVDGEIVGAVRLYPLDGAGLWKGDRLAVLPEARVHRASAGCSSRSPCAPRATRGGQRMVAQIQERNVRFFEHLGWAADGPAAPYRGVTHQPMAIALRVAGP